jgi:hypothetical protein
MVYLGRCTSGGHIGGSIVDLDDVIISNTIEMWYHCTNHRRILTLQSETDHSFRD